MTPNNRQQGAHHFLLHPEDTPTQTFGCRGAAPGFCKLHRHPTCALVRADGLCLTPPLSWKWQYAKLTTTRADEE